MTINGKPSSDNSYIFIINNNNNNKRKKKLLHEFSRFVCFCEASEIHAPSSSWTSLFIILDISGEPRRLKLSDSVIYLND